MKIKDVIKILLTFCLLLTIFNLGMFFHSNEIYATTSTKCTHTVYKDNNPSTYHYTYCNICGKCKKRTKHSVKEIVNTGNISGHKTYCSCGKYLGLEDHETEYCTKYNDTFHRTHCECGYVGVQMHINLEAEQLSAGEYVKGKRYSTKEDLDTYHKVTCIDCDEKLGVDEHTWARGSTMAHRCSGCGRVHSKQNDATKGLHYFNIEKITHLGNVGTCEVCNAILQLEYTGGSILPHLPKKEEYTMVGNPNPMKEVILNTDQKIKSNYMPINEKR